MSIITNSTTTLFNLPLLVFKDVVMFPHTIISIDINDNFALKAIKESLDQDKEIVIAMQQKSSSDDPTVEDVCKVGCLCKIEEIKNESMNSVKITIKGVSRCKLLRVRKEELFFTDASFIDNKDESLAPQLPTLIKAITKTINDTAKVTKNFKLFNNDFQNISDANEFCDIISHYYIIDSVKQQELLECTPLAKRMELLYSFLIEQLEILKMESRIQARVRDQIEQNQKTFYLNEQIKSIQEELGNTDANEIAKYREKLKELKLNEEAREKVEQEIIRYEQIPSSSPEAVVSRTYIEYILGMPWGEYKKDQLDLNHAKKILDENHYGLEKVKERIIEFVAVLHKKSTMRGPILCFVGPPGVGKTSIVRAISEALGRKFVQMSLGGVRDEAEIRGHRRTYVSAIPGRIISGIKQAGTMNPLFLFDEIDKMSSDFRGDPASAMLEVLDSEQNFAFRDHYLDIPFDLSNVMFITTANTTDTIPPALLDRMEIIEVPSYTYDEKLQIAKRHLVPKQIKEHGLNKNSVKISDDILKELINGYTRESGVRSLERLISKLIRKSIVYMLEHKNKSITINKNRMLNFLGSRRFSSEQVAKEPMVGVVNGLAFTPYGGVLLTIECLALDGSGKIYLTGKLGDVMKESADAALSWVRANYVLLGIEKNFFSNTDIHIHVPEGAIPKDGPSAGVTIAVAMVSVLTNSKVRQDIAMTGEITLLGNVLPIGGLKEKLFAAYRNSIYTIFIPEENIKDLEELPDEIVNSMEIIPVKNIKQILEKAFI